MKRGSLIVDCDDILSLTMEKFVRICNEEFNRKITLEDINEWDLDKIFPDIDFRELFGREGFYRYIEPVPGAQYYLKKLYDEGCDIFIASAIAVKKSGEREDWLNEHFAWLPENSFSPIHRKDLLVGDVMLDDGLHNLFSSKCTYPIVFDRPWNRKPTDFLRVYNWKEFYELVTSLLYTEEKTAI